ncbi:MAG TPA: hypothetical protein VEQ59_07550 [Polyangiaceae bacterium]|nr:hypothetical protein [Polyangiaceae bacterium]
MAALTYVFAHLGPHPLEQAFAAEREPVPEPTRAPEPPPAEPQESEPTHTAEPSAAPLADALDSAVPAAEPPAVEAALASARETQPRRDLEKVARARSEPPSERESVASVSLPDGPPAAFPEFTDSSRSARRERAADGPRIGSLFERATDAPSDPAPAAPSPAQSKPESRGGPLMSCEAAVARNAEQLTIGGPRGPADITREAYASILQNGRYLAGCRVPERTVIEICAAVKNGRAVGVTVVSNPPAGTLDSCVRGAVAGLSFPQNERLDVTHTRFDAVAR